jgi:hypothetical protein
LRAYVRTLDSGLPLVSSIIAYVLRTVTRFCCLPSYLGFT